MNPSVSGYGNQYRYKDGNGNGYEDEDKKGYIDDDDDDGDDFDKHSRSSAKSYTYAMQQGQQGQLGSENSRTYLRSSQSQPYSKRMRSDEQGHVSKIGTMGVVGAKAKEGTRVLHDALVRRFTTVFTTTTTKGSRGVRGSRRSRGSRARTFRVGETGMEARVRDGEEGRVGETGDGIGMSLKKSLKKRGRGDEDETRRTTPTARPGTIPARSLRSHHSNQHSGYYEGEGWKGGGNVLGEGERGAGIETVGDGVGAGAVEGVKDREGEGGSLGLQRKGTYLLTGSPVIRGVVVSGDTGRELDRDRDVEEFVLDGHIDADDDAAARVSPVSLPRSLGYQGRIRALPVPPLNQAGGNSNSNNNHHGSHHHHHQQQRSQHQEPQKKSRSLASELKRPGTQETGIESPLADTYEETVPAYSPPPTADAFRVQDEKRGSIERFVTFGERRTTTTTATTTATASGAGLHGNPEDVSHAYPPPPPLITTTPNMQMRIGAHTHAYAHARPSYTNTRPATADGGGSGGGPRSLSSSSNSNSYSSRPGIPRHEEGGTGMSLTLANVRRHNNDDLDTRQGRVHPLVRNFVSPLDLFERRPEGGDWNV